MLSHFDIEFADLEVSALAAIAIEVPSDKTNFQYDFCYAGFALKASVMELNHRGELSFAQWYWISL